MNAWILYRRHYKQYGLPGNKSKSLLIFSQEIAEGLIKLQHQAEVEEDHQRESVEESVQKRPGGKKPAIPLLGDDVIA